MFIGRISKDQHLDTLVDWIKALPWSYFALHLPVLRGLPAASQTYLDAKLRLEPGFYTLQALVTLV